MKRSFHDQSLTFTWLNILIVTAQIIGVLQKDADIEARITSIERKTRRITLSIKALEAEVEGRAIEEYASKGSTTVSLGEKLMEQLEKQDP